MAALPSPGGANTKLAAILDPGGRLYRCEKCHVVVPEGTPANFVFTATRRVVYPERPHANKVPRGKRRAWRHDPGGEGWERVGQMLVCAACAETHVVEELTEVRVIEGPPMPERPERQRYNRD